MGYYFYFPPENKIVVARYKNIISQEVSGRVVELEKIQDEDTSPSENTSEIPMEVEGFEPPQEEVVLVRRSARTHRAPDCLCLNIEVEEHSLGDLNEPTNYKAALLDPESDKWVDAMNVKMQSMKDNQDWSRLVAKGYTQTYGVDYEETFSPVADIRAIRILIAIAAFYDYEIWQMDVNTAFLNRYLNEDINMVQPEVDCYYDAGFETDGDDIKSQTGYVFVLNEGAVDWKSSKQSTTAMSATEAEYIAASVATMDAVWIRKFISGLGIVPTINKPIKMFCDNSAALLIANKPGVQRGAKHYH
ncbi:retrotransposon protein, putative, ty1-copia subclass [Tanacetum coccineum]